MLAELMATVAVFMASAGVLLYWKDRKAVYQLVDSVADLKNHPEWAGKALAAAYPPQDIAGILNAIVEAQKPSLMNFIESEGIPLLATIGGGEVAENARLARAAKKLGGGAVGLQGLMGLISAPSKKSGVGDLLSYLPLIQQLMGPGGIMSKSSAPTPGSRDGTVKW